ncbi:hypothetical protein ABZ554_27645 [Streptomyces sp. NPDC020125]|uniref:hypothetical protein n=1 Tax=Streptomyces sp. NPDC020125 TaxID=3154593 RepID=UPI0033DA1895
MGDADGLPEQVHDIVLTALESRLPDDAEGGEQGRGEDLGAQRGVRSGGKALFGRLGEIVRGDELFSVEVAHRRLRAISPGTGESRIDAENLAVGLPPGSTRTEPEPIPGVPGRPRQFAGLAVAPDGALLVSANGEGSVLRLTGPAE